jgi:hypothetical protein
MNPIWIERKFEGLTRAELRQAGAELGCTFGPNMNESTMRIRLCEKLGEGIPNAPNLEPDQTPAGPVRMKRMQRPRLAPGDAWEGKRQRVRVNRSKDEETHSAFVLYWNGAARAFPYDQVIDMPWPYWVHLRDIKVGKLFQDKVRDADGVWTSNTNREVFTPLFSYTDMGVTPGTEHLPESILHYWQMEALAKNYFRDYIPKQTGRNTLIQIRSDLKGSSGASYYKDLTNEDIWQEIIQFLGFEDIMYEDYEDAIA